MSDKPKEGINNIKIDKAEYTRIYMMGYNACEKKLKGRNKSLIEHYEKRLSLINKGC